MTCRHGCVERIGKEVQFFIENNPEDEIRAPDLWPVQKAIHHEISMYGTLREYANQLNNVEAERLLSEILQDEKVNDRELTETARSGINHALLGRGTVLDPLLKQGPASDEGQ